MDKKNKNEKKKETVNVNQLDEEIKRLKQEVDVWRNKYLRALADYQNLEKRVDQERQEFQKLVNKNLLLKFISVLDEIERAMLFIDNEGLKLIKKKFLQILNEEEVKEIDLIGKKFDPNLAEVIEVVQGKEDDIIVEIVKKGYYYHDKVLRVAQVKVSKKISIIEGSDKNQEDQN